MGQWLDRNTQTMLGLVIQNIGLIPFYRFFFFHFVTFFKLKNDYGFKE